MIKDELIFKDLTSLIIGAAMEVHNTLGPGFLENIYENALVVELSKHRNLNIQTQKSLAIEHKGEMIGKHVMDMIVENKVIIELKAVEKILPIHEAQIISYMTATKIPVGLLMNFGSKRLAFRRFANTIKNPRNPRNLRQIRETDETQHSIAKK